MRGWFRISFSYKKRAKRELIADAGKVKITVEVKRY